MNGAEINALMRECAKLLYEHYLRCEANGLVRKSERNYFRSALLNDRPREAPPTTLPLVRPVGT